MKLSLIILGVLLILGGAFGYILTEPSWKVSFFFIPIWIPNPFAIFRPLVLVSLALGAICFILGLIFK